MGIGEVLGNLKDDIIRSGSALAKGIGRVLGNMKKDVIFEGSAAAVGPVDPLGVLKTGMCLRVLLMRQALDQGLAKSRILSSTVWREKRTKILLERGIF